jgi:hypothetical protein
LTRVVPVLALICSITFLYTAFPSSTTIATTSSDTRAALDNVTSLNQTLPALVNQTLPALVNQTLPALVNQTLTSLNETVSEQARRTEEARENVTRLITSLNETVSEQARRTEEAGVLNATEQTAVLQEQARVDVVRDLPNNLSWMLGSAVVLVIAVPVIIDLVLRRITSEERADFYRALMTFGVIIVVGVVVVYLIALINVNILIPNANVDPLIDVLTNLSTILGTAMATIVAFYFGTRVARGRGGGGGGKEEETEDEKRNHQ